MEKIKKSGIVAGLYESLSSGRLVLVFGAIYLISQALIGIILSPLGHDPLLLQITCSKDVFVRIIQSWNPDSLATYYRHFYLDLVHPLFYALFLSSAMASLNRQKDQAPKPTHLFLFALPYVAGLCDLIENCMHLILIPKVPDISPAMVAASGAATTLKWALACVCIATIFYFLIKKLIKTTKNNKKKAST